jgi:hypothetical protein
MLLVYVQGFAGGRDPRGLIRSHTGAVASCAVSGRQAPARPVPFPKGAVEVSGVKGGPKGRRPCDRVSDREAGGTARSLRDASRPPVAGEAGHRTLSNSLVAETAVTHERAPRLMSALMSRPATVDPWRCALA